MFPSCVPFRSDLITLMTVGELHEPSILHFIPIR
jgi:hypothetical protein